MVFEWKLKLENTSVESAYNLSETVYTMIYVTLVKHFNNWDQ